MQTISLQRASAVAVDTVLWVFLAALLGLTFAKHTVLCGFPYQAEPTEAGMLQSARVLEQGGDPWAPAIAPESYNAYGLGYPWVAAQWHRWEPRLPWLLLLRMTTAMGVLAALGMMALALREEQVSAMETAALLTLLYPVLIFPDSYAARPDGLGTAFYLACLLWARQPGRRNVALAGVLGATAFFIKTYMALALPVAAIMLWVEGRRRDVGVLALAAMLTGSVLGLAVLWRYPHYLEGTFLVNTNTQDHLQRLWSWLWRQVYDLAVHVHWPITLALPLAGWWAWRRGKSLAPEGATRPWAWASLGVMLALAAGPGKHTGAYLRYYNELLLPLLGIAILFWLRQLGFGRRAVTALLLVDALMAVSVMMAWPRPITQERLAEWARADAWIAAHPFGVYPAAMASLSIAHGGFVNDTGHTYVLKYSSFAGHPTTLGRAALRREQWVSRQLRESRVQSVVCMPGECPPEVEASRYRRVGQFCMYTPLCFEIYIPRRPQPLPAPYLYADDTAQ
jgi:hypothetical protein